MIETLNNFGEFNSKMPGNNFFANPAVAPKIQQ
jgi:hypothetical protein